MLPTLRAEAAVNTKKSRARAVRRLSTGAAIAVAAIGIGIAIFLANQDNKVEDPTSKSDEKDPSILLGNDKPKIRSPDVITEYFSIFRQKDVRHDGRRWTIEAGHRFAKEANQAGKNWEKAWCYTQNEANGITVKLDLANRNQRSSKPVVPKLKRNTLDALSLNNHDLLFLASNCPWLDKKEYESGEFTQPYPVPNKPSESIKTKENVAIIGVVYSSKFGSNYQGCMADCKTEKQCKGFLFVNSNKSCRLFKQIKAEQSLTGVRSGIKN